MHHPLFNVLPAWVALVLPFSRLATATPFHHDDSLEAVSSRALAGRSDPVYPYGAIFCGKFSTADRGDAAVLLEIMRTRLEHEPRNNCTTPARTCRRHACYNTSGIYVCNDNHHDIELMCDSDVALVAGPMMNQCCQGGHHKGTSSQQFVDGSGYNVIISYANCNHDKDADFPSMGPPSDPWGPNGVCSQQ